MNTNTSKTLDIQVLSELEEREKLLDKLQRNMQITEQRYQIDSLKEALKIVAQITGNKIVKDYE